MCAVYLDDMCDYPMGEYKRMKMSHMIADTEEELHAFARRLGMKRGWYQGDHYDVAKGRRKEAIEMGAIPVPLRTLARMVMMRRRTGKLPTPAEAEKDAAQQYKKTRKRYV